ncbi:MAG: DUF5679 domain-containing protein [Gemmatimonadaceae bacterium]
MYCLSCRKKTADIAPKTIITESGRKMKKAKCKVCARPKSQFLPGPKKPAPKKSGPQRGGDVVDTIGNLIGEVHLRTAPSLSNPLGTKYSFCGPGTRLDKRLGPDNKPLPHSKPIDRVDSSCYAHDLAYRAKDKAARARADDVFLRDLEQLEKLGPTPQEARAIRIIRPIIKAKKKFGLGKKR